MKPILEIKNLETHFFLDEGELCAVNGITLSLYEGEILAIVGESGSGKSVSLLSVMGLVPMPPGKILRGEVLFSGLDLLKISDKDLRKIRGKDIAMIFQDPMTSLNPVMRIGKQIEESLKLHLKMSNKQAWLKAIELLEMVGIPDAEQRGREYPHQFSGGMRQRVMIALALACEPKVLIADEPTTALDVTIQAQVTNLIKGLQQELGMAVIWITHDLGVVASLADRIAVMYAGRIVEQGDVEPVFAHSRHPYTLGLLKSIPSLDEKVPEELPEIRGVPPDCINLPVGCSFAPRCDYKVARCLDETPSLVSTDRTNLNSACIRWEDIVKNNGK
jgi:oligopeptide transport system ATP-binding protein